MAQTNDAVGKIHFVAPLAGENPIKIGFTGNELYVRLSTLALGCPVPLKVLATCPGSFMDELALHNRFISQHSHGEWFHASEEITALVARIAEAGEIPDEYRSKGNEPYIMRRRPKTRFAIAGLAA